MAKAKPQAQVVKPGNLKSIQKPSPKKQKGKKNGLASGLQNAINNKPNPNANKKPPPKNQANGKQKLEEIKAAQKKIEKELEQDSDELSLDESDAGSNDEDVSNMLNSTFDDSQNMSEDDSDLDFDDEELSSDEDTAVSSSTKPTAGKEQQSVKAKDKKTVEKKEGKSGKPIKKELTPEQIEARKNAISVFIGNLPINTKRKKLHKMFDKFGKILSIRFRTNQGTQFGRVKQKVTLPNVIAFVDYETMEQAQASLVMNGEKLGDKILRVDLQQNSKGKNFDSKRTIFVRNLKYSCTDEKLHETFSSCGDIEYVRPLQCGKGCKGTAYVCFKDAASVVLSLKLDKTLIDGREIGVERYNISKLGTGKPKSPQNSPNKNTAVKKNGSQPGAQNIKKEKNKPTFEGVKKAEKKNKPKHKNSKGNKALANKIAPKNTTAKVVKQK